MLFTIQSSIRLNNEVEMPRLGLGVYQSPPDRITQRVVRYALNIGYRHIDTAYIYGNESDIGNAVLESGISREEVFVTTKLWNTDQVGYDYAIKACKIQIYLSNNKITQKPIWVVLFSLALQHVVLHYFY